MFTPTRYLPWIAAAVLLWNGCLATWPVRPALAAAAPRARTGLVGLAGQAFTDGGGPYLALGASLFWAVWGFQHDRARLEAHLQYLARLGVDYVRVLGSVGPDGWTDRTADPTAPGFDAAIAGVTDMAYRSGLRVEWTIFGGLEKTPTPASRRSLVERFAAMAKGREPAIQHWEIANEAWATGWDGREAEAAELSRLLQRLVPQPVAVTAADCGTSYYPAGVATLRTVHVSRAIDGAGGPWTPLLRTWEAPSCPGPKAWTSNEPIGPGASVASEDDPLRLITAAATTWLSGGAAYVLHTRPGVRGGGREDMEKYGGPASMWEVPRLGEILGGMRAVRRLLPSDLPNWRREECGRGQAGGAFECEGGLRTFCASSKQDIVCLPLAIKGTFVLRARSRVAGEWFEPLSGQRLGRFDLEPGEEVRIVGRSAVVIRARQR